MSEGTSYALSFHTRTIPSCGPLLSLLSIPLGSSEYSALIITFCPSSLTPETRNSQSSEKATPTPQAKNHYIEATKPTITKNIVGKKSSVSYANSFVQRYSSSSSSSSTHIYTLTHTRTHFPWLLTDRSPFVLASLLSHWVACVLGLLCQLLLKSTASSTSELILNTFHPSFVFTARH